MIGVEQLFIDEPGRPVGRARRLLRTAFVFAIAAILLWFVADESHEAATVRRWPVVPCTVVSSDVDVDEGLVRVHPYHTAVAFQFDFAGRPHVGHRLATQGRAGTDDAAEAYSAAAALPVGSSHQCHVDAADPSESVLVGPVPWWERFLPLAIATVAVAFVAAYGVPQVWLAVTAPGRLAPPRDAVGRRRAGYLWGGALFPGAGAFVVVGWVIPLAHTAAAQRWPAVPCRIEAARVQQQTVGGEVPITTYRTDVLYRYAIAGRTYHSNCYNLTECGSPARGGRDRAAAAFPAGRAAVCYVDPADPAVATLTRHVSPTVALAAWPATIALVGLVGLIDGGVGRTSKALAGLVRRRKASVITVVAAIVGLTVVGVFGTP